MVKIKTIGDAYFAVAGLTDDTLPPKATAAADAKRGSLSSVDDDDNDDIDAATPLTRQTAQGSEQMSSTVRNLLSLLEFCFEAQECVAQHRFHVPEAAEIFATMHASSDDTHMHDRERERSQSVLRDAFTADGCLKIRIRIGVHCGDVVAGVVGKKQPVRACVRC